MPTTQENLQAAFAGESQARNKYTIFAKVAKKEGYHYVAKIFEETADNERRHAKDHFALMGMIGDTVANLQAAVDGETYETTTMYPEFAAQAEAEGNKQAASLFKQLATIEAHHAERYQKLLDMVKAGTLYKRDKPIAWKCAVCGKIHVGAEPPGTCPACKHLREHFEPADMSFED
jgi:rubrerythrin